MSVYQYEQPLSYSFQKKISLLIGKNKMQGTESSSESDDDNCNKVEGIVIEILYQGKQKYRGIPPFYYKVIREQPMKKHIFQKLIHPSKNQYFKPNSKRIILPRGKFIQILPQNILNSIDLLYMREVYQLILPNNIIKQINFLNKFKLLGLSHIDLSQNSILSVESLSLCDFPQLQQINLHSNVITRIDTLRKGSFPFLSKLILYNNLIPQVSKFSDTYFPQLQSLDIHQNQIIDVRMLLKTTTGSLHSINLLFCEIYKSSGLDNVRHKLNSSQEIRREMSQAIKKVGNYMLIRRIGYGATSEVFQGRRNGSSDRYAIKMIRLTGMTTKQRQMINQQVQIIKNISHPNIVILQDSLQTTNNYYLIFQYCQKGDLQHFLKNNHTPLIPQQTAQRIIFCLADAISLIHSKGIVHRDIKLSNVLLKKDCEIKLADFGFAKQVNQQFMMQTYCGTPITMAPQILQGKFYDMKCDIWSLGVILFQLVYGKLPFPINQGYNNFVQLVTSKELIIPSYPQMPGQFKELLRGSLQKDPQNRLDANKFLQNKWIQQGNIAIKVNQSNKIQTVGQLLRNVSCQVKVQVQDYQKIHTPKKEQINGQHSDDQGQSQHNSKNTTPSNSGRIQQLVSQRVHSTLIDQIQRIIQRHLRMRQALQKNISTSPFADKLVESRKDLLGLLYRLDANFIEHLFENPMVISTQTDLQKFKLSQLRSLSRPKSLGNLHYTNILLKNQQKKKYPIEVTSTLQNFLRNSLVMADLMNQDKKKVYELVMEYLDMMRRFTITTEILFPTHHYVQISLNKILSVMKSGQFKQNLQLTSPQANYATIALECKNKDQKMTELIKTLRENCQKRVNDIDKELHGY